MQATGVGPLVVHRATTRLGIEQMAIAAGPSGQTEDAVFKIEMVDLPGLGQAFGDLLGVVVFGFKRIDHAQPHQIGHFDLDGHGAAVGGATVTQTFFVTGPGLATVDVHNGNGGSHGEIIPAGRGSRCFSFTPVMESDRAGSGQVSRLRVGGEARCV